MRPGSATYHEGAARLRPRQSSALRGRGGFPALCFLPSISSLFVSIPFIAGRWSLSLSMGRASPSMRAFQSPSLRGSGRFEPRPDAVRRGGVRVLIPFLAGQWSLRFLDVVLPLQDLVLIPFIAGQWSLPKGGSMKEHEARAFQSPSLRGSGRFFSPPSCGRGPRAGFNPLHCGAVVASVRIAGLTSGAVVFQSPSLRGSGRFGNALKSPRFPRNRFNPLHCGAVVASGGAAGGEHEP